MKRSAAQVEQTESNNSVKTDSHNSVKTESYDPIRTEKINEHEYSKKIKSGLCFLHQLSVSSLAALLCRKYSFSEQYLPKIQEIVKLRQTQINDLDRFI